MSKFTILRLGQGSLEDGFPDVEVRLGEHSQLIAQQSGALPPNKILDELLKRWQFLYEQFYHHRYYSLRGEIREGIEIETTGITSFSEQAFQEVIIALKTTMQAWLNSPSMLNINNVLRTKFSEQDEISVVIETTDLQLQRLPWHFWQFFEDYRQAEPILGNRNFGQVRSHPVRDRHRILIVLGNREGIDTTQDELILQQLAAEFKFLVEPSRLELTNQLRQPQGWDILFFAGHSSSQSEGKIFLNATDEITVAQFRNALQMALSNGLQLVILNSCDGSRIAQDLLHLNLATAIVMKESVPNQVAQDFLKAFLQYFATGQSLPTAVRLARETLEGYELEFPCASWLPGIWQNSALSPMRWQEEEETPSTTCQDWGESIDVCPFYGREPELALLQDWIERDRCRVVALIGMGGIGKTSLATKLAKQLASVSFEFVIWRSLRNSPTVEELISDLVQFFSGQQDITLPASLESQVTHLLDYLRQWRCLIVLDNLESLLESETNAGQYSPGYEGYGYLLRQIGEVCHQSCLLLTSREKTGELAFLEGDRLPVRSYRLKGLTYTDGQALFEDRGCFGINEQEVQEVVNHYAGNPLALRIVAASVREIVAGDLTELLPLLRQGIFHFAGIDDLLERQFNRLSEAELQIMYWLAINCDPVSLEMLKTDILAEQPIQQILAAVQSLGRRCLIERDSKFLALQPAILAYVTERLVQSICSDILNGQPTLLRTHALLKAQSDVYIRRTQAREILQPILEKLALALGGAKQIEQYLKTLLCQLQTEGIRLPGYTAGNLLNLLKQLEADLSDLDCSNLTVWQANLVGTHLHRVNFSNADLSKSLFTETLNVITCVNWSPDGESLAIAGVNGEIQVWRVRDGRKCLKIQGSTTWIWSVCFSLDGQTLISGGSDCLIKLWDVKTGNCLKTLAGHTSWVQAICLNADGTQIISCGSDRLIKVWDRHSGECLRTLAGHTDSIWRICLSPNGHYLASSSDDHTIRLWNLQTGACEQVLLGHTASVYAVVFSATGQVLISGSSDRALKVWDVQSGQCLHTLQGHTNNIFALARHPIKPIVASSGRDGKIKLWHIMKGTCLRTLDGHRDRVLSIAFSPDGCQLVSGSDDQTLRLWNVETGKCLKIFRGYACGVRIVRFSPDGQTLLTGNEDGVVYQWDIEHQTCLKQFEGHDHWVPALDWNADGQTFVSGAATSLRIWQVATGKCLRTLMGHEQYIHSVTFSPNGNIFVSAGGENILYVWQSQIGECLHRLQGHTNRIWSIAFSPDGRILASSSHDRTVKLWDMRTGTCLRTLTGHRHIVFSVAFSPDGQLLASSGDDCTIRLWDVHTGACQTILQDTGSIIFSVAFSPDGSLIASGSDDQQVKLWHVATGRCLRSLKGHTNAIWSVAFHPQQPILASGSQDGTTKLWDWQTYDCIATLQSIKPYQDMNITNVMGLTEAQKTTLRSLGAIDRNF